MRKILTILLVSLPCLQSGAQDRILQELTAILDGNCVKLSYRYENSAGVPLGSGTASIQGVKYQVSEGNIRFFCDGQSTWSVDSGTKEVYIEKAGNRNDLFGNLKEVLPKLKNLAYDGKKNVSLTITLSDKVGPINCKALIEEVSPASEERDFSFDTGALDSSWIVTDLR